MTNGGKSTMSSSLHLRIPNSCIIAQDAFFKDDSVIALDSNGFKQYDVLDALHMDRMMSKIESWRKDPDSFLASQSLKTQCSVGEEVFVLIVEGFLIFNYGPLVGLYNLWLMKRTSLWPTFPVIDSSRVYTPPDLPGYFDGYVWPMYLKNRQEMEDMVLDIVFLDGLESKEGLLDYVYRDVTMEIQRLMGKDLAV
ncbi:nicotinamide riboside kinase 1 isoform X3 [Coregonus clupeaformis]|nr:nicotinamide riboside kinase 1 isoform X3 [Coregonus clupeaformis]